MADDKSKNGEARRTGEEVEIQRELKRTDEKVGQVIKDKPYSDNRNERRRGQFIDFWGDEDGDPSTSERTHRIKTGDPRASLDSTPPTTATTAVDKTKPTTDK